MGFQIPPPHNDGDDAMRQESLLHHIDDSEQNKEAREVGRLTPVLCAQEVSQLLQKKYLHRRWHTSSSSTGMHEFIGNPKARDEII